MPNQNTVVDALRVAGLAPDTPLSINSPGGAQPVLFTIPATAVANAGAPVALNVPVVAAEGIEIGPLAGHSESTSNLWYADSNMFLVRAQGRVSPLSFAKTLKIYLYVGNGVNPASAGGQQDYELGLLSATLPAASTNAANSNWFLEAKCLWDSSSLVLNGVLSGMIGGTAIAATGFSVVNPTAFAAQQAAGSYNPLSFVVGVNLTASPATQAGVDVVALEEFTAEQV